VNLDLDKLAKVLEMLRSEYEGERLAAVERANQMLTECGLTWTEFVKGRQEQPKKLERPRRTAQDLAYTRLAHRMASSSIWKMMTTKEQGFVAQMAYSWPFPVSQAQRAWLDLLAIKYGFVR
jgi:hypothetical protein